MIKLLRKDCKSTINKYLRWVTRREDSTELKDY